MDERKVRALLGLWKHCLKMQEEFGEDDEHGAGYSAGVQKGYRECIESFERILGPEKKRAGEGKTTER